MAKLNRIAMDLIHKSNKPENLKGIVNKGYAFDYAEYLIDKGIELPQVIVDYILKVSQQYKTPPVKFDKVPKLIGLTIKMKEKGLKVPDSFIEIISENYHLSEIYIIDLIKKELLDKIEPKIYEVLLRDNGKIKHLLNKMEEEGVANYEVFPIKVLNSMLESLTLFAINEHDNFKVDEDSSYFCADILDTLMAVRGRITSFNQINPDVITAILKSENAKELFVNSLVRNRIEDLPKKMVEVLNRPKLLNEPFAKKTKELVDALVDYKNSIDKVQESFSSWFKKR